MTKGKHSSLAAMMLAGSLSVGAQAQAADKSPEAANAGTQGPAVGLPALPSGLTSRPFNA